MMVNAGFNKFFNYMPLPEMNESAAAAMTAFMAMGWLMPLVAVVEIVAGVMFFASNFRALGAVIIFPVTVGIFLINSVQDPAGIIMAIVLLAINVWVIFENKDKYRPMIK